MSGQVRLGFIDGLRGIAIAAVLGFHAFSRWPEQTGLGMSLAEFPLFKFGWLGVQLFFLISGFVILMTLERSSGWLVFMKKRWLRLFPAMLICSAIVFLTAPLFPERPMGQPQWRDLVPGLLLLDPDTLGLLTQSPWHMLEGSFWSLFVEFKFYVVFGALFFLLGERWAIGGIFGVFLAWVLCRVGIKLHPESALLGHLKVLFEVLGANYYAWFVAGALYFLHFKRPNLATLSLAFAASALAALSFGMVLAPKLAGLVVCLIFLLGMTSQKVQQALQWRPLLFVGFISYPLYLVHENLLIAATTRLAKWWPECPHLLVPVLPVIGLAAIAWVVAAHLEPRLRRSLENGLDAIAVDRSASRPAS